MSKSISCSVNGCNVDIEEILYLVDDVKKRFIICPTHLLMYVFELFNKNI